MNNHKKGLLALIEKVFSLTHGADAYPNPEIGSWASGTKDLYDYGGPHLSG
ncbi:MAG: hypothetical protein AAF620_20165 [Bacteroidota bacterium]